MAITQSQTNSNGVLNRAQGRFLDNAATPAAAVVNPGFLPRRFVWINLTDRISWEWLEGMAVGTTLKQAANGDRTLDTSDVAISVDDGSGDQDGAGSGSATSIPGIAPNGQVTIAAAIVLQNKQYAWIAEG